MLSLKVDSNISIQVKLQHIFMILSSIVIMVFKYLSSFIYENGKLFLMKNQKFDDIINSLLITVRPRDTRPQAARTLQVHVFELDPKKSEMNEFM